MNEAQARMFQLAMEFHYEVEAPSEEETRTLFQLLLLNDEDKLENFLEEMNLRRYRSE
jgi:hypothetical protein